jgi:hypothetical protein
MEFLVAIIVLYVIITFAWTMSNLGSGCEFEPISIYWPLWIILVLPVICIKDLWKRIKEAWKNS